MFRWIKYNLRYLGNPPWDSGVSPPELLVLIEQELPGRALDLGAGTGTNMLTLARAGWQVDGIEYAWLAVLKARKKLRNWGYPPSMYCREVTHLDFLKEKYDLILDIGCFHGLSCHQRAVYIENLKKRLKENGIFLLYAFHSLPGKQVGITQSEIDRLSNQFTLVERQEGLDRRERVSVWLQFRNSSKP